MKHCRGIFEGFTYYTFFNKAQQNLSIYFFYSGFILYNQLLYNIISTMEDIIIKMAWRLDRRSQPAVTLPIGIALYYIFILQVGLLATDGLVLGEERAFPKGLG